MCLICLEIESVLLAVSFDIDSFLGFAQSLAFVCQRIDFNLFLYFYINIQNDLYFYITVYYNYSRSKRPVYVKLKKVFYYYAGRILGYKDITFYIFFFWIYNSDKLTNFSKKSNKEIYNFFWIWTDLILLSAIFCYISAISRQHFLHFWKYACQKAVAYYKEYSIYIVDKKLLNQILLLYYFLYL